MIEKPSIIITSLGRTGTLFFARLYRELFPGCTSLHEPDILTIEELRKGGEGIANLFSQIREAGFYNKVIRKTFGDWSLSAVSDARVCSKLNYQQAVKRVLDQRTGFIESRWGLCYVESSSAYYGLLDVLKEVFDTHRAVFIVRDGRDWINSRLDWQARGGLYSKGRFRQFFSHPWPTARTTNDAVYSSRWDSMSDFEKLCWAWAKLNKYAIDSTSLNSHSRWFRFEDIFRSPERQDHLAALIDFTTGIQAGLVYDKNLLASYLDHQVHASSKKHASPEGWSFEQKKQFWQICGPLMDNLGYPRQ